MSWARQRWAWLLGLLVALLVGVGLGASGQKASKTATVVADPATVTEVRATPASDAAQVDTQTVTETRTETVTVTKAAAKPKPKPAVAGVIHFSGAGIKQLRPFRTFQGRELFWTLAGDTSGTGFSLYDETGDSTVLVSSSGNAGRGSTYMAAGLHTFNVNAPSGSWTITIR